MANIIFDVAPFICETPIFTSVTYTGTRYQFNLDWTSLGDYYLTFDPTTTITLYVDIYDEYGVFIQTNTVFSDQSSFNMTGVLVNTLDYVPSLSAKNRVVFRLLLTNAGCNNTAIEDIPANSY